MRIKLLSKPLSKRQTSGTSCNLSESFGESSKNCFQVSGTGRQFENVTYGDDSCTGNDGCEIKIDGISHPCNKNECRNVSCLSVPNSSLKCLNSGDQIEKKMSPVNKIYHEKQVKSLCALHALNNLFQESKAFSQTELDGICSNLAPNSWLNPHKSVLGLGNYDINVIMTALQLKNYEAIWFDKRKDPGDLNFSQIFGFILNIPSDCKLGWLALPIKRKHWIAIRNLPNSYQRENGCSQYYNLDSKFDSPETIGNEEKLLSYLREELKSPEKELFLVVTNEVSRTERWKKQPNVTNQSQNNTTEFSGSSKTTALPAVTANPTTPRKTSNDSGVVELLGVEFKDINVVDLDKDEMLRRQSSGVWSDSLNNS